MDNKEEIQSTAADQARELIDIADKTLLLKYREKYYNEALDLLKAQAETEEIKKLIQSANKKLNTARAKAIISKYHECQKEEKMYSSPKDMDSVGNHYASTAKLIKSTTIDEKYLSEDLVKKLHGCYDAEQKAKKLHKHSKSTLVKRRFILLAFILIIIAGITGNILASKTGGYHLALGKALHTLGLENKAKDEYLIAYNDYENKEAYDIYVQTKLKELDEYIADANWTDATDACKKLKDMEYTDFEDKLVLVEKNLMANADFGDKVYFGGEDWFLADRIGSRCLLIKKNAITPDAELVFSDSSANTSWESSSMRRYLNSVYFGESFSEKEKELIIESTIKADINNVYKGVKVNDTKDKVFLLSVDELNRYTDYINKTTKSGWWTRTPGANEGTLVFVDINKKILYYGYEMTEESIKMKPIIWVDTNL